MQTKVLGRTGLEVSVVGLGAAFLGMARVDAAAGSYDDLVMSVDKELGTKTVLAALEAGCTLIDTASLYGSGRSEEIIGRALAERPDLAARCLVTTKVGRTLAGQDYSYDGVMRGIEACLRRLGLDQLQIVYIHDPMGVDPALVMEADRALGALRQLQREGVIRYIGTAADDPRTNVTYIETGEFDAAVVPRAWSLINRYAEERILPAAVRHNVGLVVATSLERGLLATGPKPGVHYFERSYSPACQAHVARIQALCRAYEIPLAAAALQWVTRHPQVASTVAGARFPEEARANAAAAEYPIPEDFWAELAPLVLHWDDAVGA